MKTVAIKQELSRWEMRDPMTVLMSREAAARKRSCTGCSHIKVVEDPFGDSLIRCLKGRPYGKRCARYEGQR